MMAGIIAPYGPCPLRGDSLIALSVTYSAVVNDCTYNVTWLKALSRLVCFALTSIGSVYSAPLVSTLPLLPLVRYHATVYNPNSYLHNKRKAIFDFSIHCQRVLDNNPPDNRLRQSWYKKLSLQGLPNYTLLQESWVYDLPPHLSEINSCHPRPYR